MFDEGSIFYDAIMFFLARSKQTLGMNNRG